jgi:hypothetical protein
MTEHRVALLYGPKEQRHKSACNICGDVNWTNHLCDRHKRKCTQLKQCPLKSYRLMAAHKELLPRTARKECPFLCTTDREIKDHVLLHNACYECQMVFVDEDYYNFHIDINHKGQRVGKDIQAVSRQWHNCTNCKCYFIYTLRTALQSSL